MKKGASPFFYRKKCSSFPRMEKVGPSPPLKGVWKKSFFLAEGLKGIH